MQHRASARTPKIGSPITKNQKSPGFVDATDTPSPLSSWSSVQPPSPVPAAVVPPTSVEVVRAGHAAVVWYTVAPPGVQFSIHRAPLVGHAGGTGHSVLVSEGCHEMCQGAWACVHEDTTVSATVVAPSTTLTQGWVAHARGQSVAE